MIEELLNEIDFSFKWILLAFNFTTIIFVYIHQRNNKRPKQHSILFVIAHPDDEAMFFRPTIRSLSDDYFVHLLCLSGGKTPREQQLAQSAKFLKIQSVTCIQDQLLIDGLKEKWCEQTIRKHVLTYVKEHNIKAIFTFDQNGISGHSNHSAIHYALKDLEKDEKEIKQTEKADEKSSEKMGDSTCEEQKREANPQQNCQAQQPQKTDPTTIKIYYLDSVMLPRKYSGALQMPIALLRTYSWFSMNPYDAYKAMSLHESQFVWYRKLWVFLSRYQYINTFRRALFQISE